jgi:hypothetical protein
MWRQPMALTTRINDVGGKEKSWQVVGDIPNVYDLMCSMSNIISKNGTHGKYYLNESKSFTLFWVCALLYCPQAILTFY